MRGDVVLDANLVILLVLGSADPRLIGHHKRLRAFEPSDLFLLNETLRAFERIVPVPNVLTEASNLIGRTDDRYCKIFIDLIGANDEIYVPSRVATESIYFPRLGLTDSVLIRLAEKGPTVLTMDAPLCAAIWSQGNRAINFNHLRVDRLESRPLGG